MAQTVEKILELARQEWDFFGKQEFDLQGRTIRRGPRFRLSERAPEPGDRRAAESARSGVIHEHNG